MYQVPIVGLVHYFANKRRIKMFQYLPKLDSKSIPSAVEAVSATRKTVDATLNTVTHKETKSALEYLTKSQFDLADIYADFYDSAVANSVKQYNAIVAA
jgi:hypothetical protein